LETNLGEAAIHASIESIDVLLAVGAEEETEASSLAEYTLSPRAKKQSSGITLLLYTTCEK